MSYSKYKLIRELHKKYYFIESHPDRFGRILFDSIPDDVTYEEALRIGNENIIKNIIYRINNKLFPRLFNRTVKRIGIKNAFDLYNTIIQTTHHQINPYDLLKICDNPNYSDFLNNAEPNGNKLLEDTLELYNSDAEISYNPSNLPPEIVEYLEWIRDFKLLKTKEEELELINKYRKTGNDDYKDEFINSNLRLVVNRVLKKYTLIPDLKVDLLDLIQAGNIGLIEAFNRFDETKGFKFSTYATWWIKCEIDKLIYAEGDTIRIPQETILTINKIDMYKNEYLAKHGFEASEEEIRNHFGMNEEAYNAIKLADATRKTLSYDVRIHDGFESFDYDDYSLLSKQTEEMEYESTEEEPIIKLPVSSDTLEEMEFNDELYLSIMDLIPEYETISVEDKSLSKAFIKQMLVYTIKTLNPFETKVMLEEWGFNAELQPLNHTQIGKKLGVTHEYIRQTEARALQKLQSNAYKINNDIPVEQEYFSTRDIGKHLTEKGINSICILNHQVYGKNTKFKCTQCNKIFTENTISFMKNTECPFCKEENKELIKK